MTTAGFCSHCGAALEPNIRFCSACGTTVGAAAPNAGAPPPAARKGGTPPLLVIGALIAVAVVAFLLLSGGDDKPSTGAGGGGDPGGSQSGSLKNLRFSPPSGWKASDPLGSATIASQFLAKDAQDLNDLQRQPTRGPRILVGYEVHTSPCTQNDVRPGLDRDPAKPVSYGRGGKLKGFELQIPRGETTTMIILLCDSSKPMTVVSINYAVPAAMASANQGTLTAFLNSLELQ